MRTGEVDGGMTCSTCTAAVPKTPLVDVAVIVVSPALNPVTTPAGLTLATSGAELVQLKLALATVWPPASSAVAVNVAVEPVFRVAPGGETVTLTICTGGVLSYSLQAPKELAAEPFQLPFGRRASDVPIERVSVSLTPMST